MPVSDTSGQIVEWVGTCTDIDDRKRARILVAGQKKALEVAKVAGEQPELKKVTDSIDTLTRTVSLFKGVLQRIGR